MGKCCSSSAKVKNGCVPLEMTPEVFVAAIPEASQVAEAEAEAEAEAATQRMQKALTSELPDVMTEVPAKELDISSYDDDDDVVVEDDALGMELELSNTGDIAPIPSEPPLTSVWERVMGTVGFRPQVCSVAERSTEIHDTTDDEVRFFTARSHLEMSYNQSLVNFQRGASRNSSVFLANDTVAASEAFLSCRSFLYASASVASHMQSVASLGTLPRTLGDKSMRGSASDAGFLSCCSFSMGSLPPTGRKVATSPGSYSFFRAGGTPGGRRTPSSRSPSVLRVSSMNSAKTTPMALDVATRRGKIPPTAPRISGSCLTRRTRGGSSTTTTGPATEILSRTANTRQRQRPRLRESNSRAQSRSSNGVALASREESSIGSLQTVSPSSSRTGASVVTPTSQRVSKWRAATSIPTSFNVAKPSEGLPSEVVDKESQQQSPDGILSPLRTPHTALSVRTCLEAGSMLSSVTHFADYTVNALSVGGLPEGAINLPQAMDLPKQPTEGCAFPVMRDHTHIATSSWEKGNPAEEWGEDNEVEKAREDVVVPEPLHGIDGSAAALFSSMVSNCASVGNIVVNECSQTNDAVGLQQEDENERMTASFVEAGLGSARKAVLTNGSVDGVAGSEDGDDDKKFLFAV